MRAGLRLNRPVQLDASQSRQFVPGRVAALADYRTIQQDQRQTLVSVLFEGRLDNFAGGESLRLLGQVMALDCDSLVRQPMEISRESRQCRIDTRTARAC